MISIRLSSSSSTDIFFSMLSMPGTWEKTRGPVNRKRKRTERDLEIWRFGNLEIERHRDLKIDHNMKKSVWIKNQIFLPQDTKTRGNVQTLFLPVWQKNSGAHLKKTGNETMPHLQIFKSSNLLLLPRLFPI